MSGVTVAWVVGPWCKPATNGTMKRSNMGDAVAGFLRFVGWMALLFLLMVVSALTCGLVFGSVGNWLGPCESYSSEGFCSSGRGWGLGATVLGVLFGGLVVGPLATLALYERSRSVAASHRAPLDQCPECHSTIIANVEVCPQCDAIIDPVRRRLADAA